MTKYLVTGSSGLIGQWIGILLDRNGEEWWGLDIKSPNIIRGSQKNFIVNICDYDHLSAIFDEVRPDIVIHLAARIDLNGISVNDYEANILGVQNVCNCIRNTPSVKRVIFTSTQLVCKVGHVPADCDDYSPNTYYGKSKVLGEKIVRELNGGGVEWCIVRPTTVWGPYMSDHYIKFLNYIEKGLYFNVGDSPLYKSYSYVENIAYQYLQISLAATSEINNKVIYLADYDPLSLRDYANSLADALGVRRPKSYPLVVCRGMACIGDLLGMLGLRFPFNSFRLNNILTEYVFNTDKTESICGPLPRSFNDGIAATVEWYRNEL